MSLSEKKLVGRLRKRLSKDLPKAVVFKHADRVTSGIPDLSVTWRRTVWIEVKFANPRIIDKGIQVETMQALEKSGIAIYVIFDNSGDEPRVIIQEPKFIREWDIDPWIVSRGFDPSIVVHVVRKLIR